MLVKHASASVFLFGRLAGGWRLGLIEHPIHGRLMIPGGHVEPDESPEQAALREVTEETGRPARLAGPPPVPVGVPAALGRVVVAQPWWILEQPVPWDNHLKAEHIHIDHLYVGLVESLEAVSEPEHPFGWHAAGDLAGLRMFDDTRLLAGALFPWLDELTAVRAAG